MARIIIFGGHGKISLLAEPLLAEAGHEVTAVIRNTDHIADVQAAGALPVVYDVEQMDVGALEALLAGHDAVVWSAGAGGGDPARTLAVDRDAAIRTMEAALHAGVRRYVMVSYFGAALDHGVDPSDSFFTYAEAKAAADENLRAAPLDWTVLAPSTLTDEPATGRIETELTREGITSGSVSRANVAAVIVATLAEPATSQVTIRFNDGDTPIDEALAVVEYE